MTQSSAPRITEVMTPSPRTIERTDPISQAWAVLDDAPFHHLVVVEGDPREDGAKILPFRKSDD